MNTSIRETLPTYPSYPLKHGKLIVVEGLDGSGKSTQIYLLKRWLELNGYRVFLTEWNSSQLVKQATSRGKKKKMLTPTTFSLIHATDFADRYERQIHPLLKAGYIVLADRYFFTAFARDVARGVDPKWVRKLYSFARIPDITFYFDVPPKVAYERIMYDRPRLKYYEAGMDLKLADTPEESFLLFQNIVYKEYQKICKEYNLYTIDGTLPITDQQLLVRTVVEENMNLDDYRILEYEEEEEYFKTLMDNEEVNA